jgi:hypothetical protein
MAAQPTRFWPRLALFLLVSVGAAVLWGGLAAFLTENILGNGLEGRVAEGVSILSDGEPVITSSIYRGRGVEFEELPDQALDRRPFVRRNREPVHGVPFHRLWLESPQLHTTRGYVVRVLQVGENRLAVTDEFDTARWYAVYDGGKEGRGYLVGYDVQSKLPLGYFGRRGFSKAEPDSADQFLLGEPNRRTTTIVRSLGKEGPTSAFVWLLDGDRLVEVDTLGRTIREIAVLPGALMLAVGRRPMLDAIDSNDEPDNGETPTERIVVVWQDDRFSVVVPRTGDVDSFRLPDEIRDVVSFSIHVVGPKTAVIQFNRNPFDYDNVRLLWITANGDVTREETVRLTGYRRQNVRLEAMKATAIVPVPLLIGTLAVLAAPDSPTHQGKSSAGAVADLLSAAWPPFLVLFLVSAALAWWVWTVHRRDGRPYAGVWAALVFSLGPAAWLAYVTERPRTPAATCPACGKRSPRNLAECASCGEDAFRPRMLGTEVFA